MANFEILTKSSQLANVGCSYKLGDKVVKVIAHLTAKKQKELGMTTKTSGIQVIYKLEIDGRETVLKGKPFSDWCRTNGIEVVGKSGEGEKTSRTFNEVFAELEKYAKTETEKLAYKLMQKQMTEAEKQIAAEKKKAEDERDRKEYERLKAKFEQKKQAKRK